MQIAWYNPELDKIVVQSFNGTSETFIEEDLDVPLGYAGVNYIISRMASVMSRKMELEMLYGSDFH